MFTKHDPPDQDTSIHPASQSDLHSLCLDSNDDDQGPLPPTTDTIISTHSNIQSHSQYRRNQSHGLVGAELYLLALGKVTPWRDMIEIC